MKHLLFLGIAGHAMSGLALAARQHGFKVSGLDETAVPPVSDWLDQQGLNWTRSASPELLDGVDRLIVSGGTPADHPTVLEAQHRGVDVLSFAELLGELTTGKHVITVAGTHGKTTTTAYITWLLEAAGHHPDYLIGIRPFNFDSSARLAGSDVFVVEGDEYKASNLDDKSKLQYYHPDVMVLTAVEHDHPDMFATEAAVIDRFTSVVKALTPDGRLVAWSGSSTVLEVAAAAACQVVMYGDEAGDFIARNIAYLPAGVEFDVEQDKVVIGRLAVPLYGRHNVLNALAAVAVALGEGLSFEQILTASAGFKGAYRRFNLLTPPTAAVTVIDDYAHHPTEAMAVIAAAKLHFPGRRVVVIYRPHTYSRTKALLSEYHRAFRHADVVYITDIESARESAAEKTVSGADIVAGLKGEAHFQPDRAQLLDTVVAASQPGDVLLCLTVSGYDRLANELADRLASK